MMMSPLLSRNFHCIVVSTRLDASFADDKIESRSIELRNLEIQTDRTVCSSLSFQVSISLTIPLHPRLLPDELNLYTHTQIFSLFLFFFISESKRTQILYNRDASVSIERNLYKKKKRNSFYAELVADGNKLFALEGVKDEGNERIIYPETFKIARFKR